MGENMSTIIKLKQETKDVLTTLKIVERESYDEVIKRLILLHEDNDGALTEATKKMINQRLKMKKEGRVKSIDQIVEKMRKENGKV